MRPLSRFLTTAWALAAVTACVQPVSESGGTLPANAVKYVFFPSMLEYLYVDSTPGQELRLDWKHDPSYSGYNCLGFIPRTATDTIGEVRFAFGGSNSGLMEQTFQGATDSVPGYFFPVNPNLMPTRGNYALQSDGRLLLNWLNGEASRYFDPSATIRLVGDTIFSDIEQSLDQGVGFVRWHVAWVLTTLC